MLQEEGMNCFVAENGTVALTLLKENPAIDIVLMDIMMPETDGYEATRQIRQQSKYEKLPVIALTAKAMKGDREKCLSAGMSDYISKPINIDQLISLMRVWLYK
jgi:CheY-like chemotaxis protein